MAGTNLMKLEQAKMGLILDDDDIFTAVKYVCLLFSWPVGTLNCATQNTMKTSFQHIFRM